MLCYGSISMWRLYFSFIAKSWGKNSVKGPCSRESLVFPRLAARRRTAADPLTVVSSFSCYLQPQLSLCSQGLDAEVYVGPHLPSWYRPLRSAVCPSPAECLPPRSPVAHWRDQGTERCGDSTAVLPEPGQAQPPPQRVIGRVSQWLS